MLLIDRECHTGSYKWNVLHFRIRQIQKRNQNREVYVLVRQELYNTGPIPIRRLIKGARTREQTDTRVILLSKIAHIEFAADE